MSSQEAPKVAENKQKPSYIQRRFDELRNIFAGLTASFSAETTTRDKGKYTMTRRQALKLAGGGTFLAVAAGAKAAHAETPPNLDSQVHALGDRLGQFFPGTTPQDSDSNTPAQPQAEAQAETVTTEQLVNLEQLRDVIVNTVNGSSGAYVRVLESFIDQANNNLTLVFDNGKRYTIAGDQIKAALENAQKVKQTALIDLIEIASIRDAIVERIKQTPPDPRAEAISQEYLMTPAEAKAAGLEIISLDPDLVIDIDRRGFESPDGFFYKQGISPQNKVTMVFAPEIVGEQVITQLDGQNRQDVANLIRNRVPRAYPNDQALGYLEQYRQDKVRPINENYFKLLDGQPHDTSYGASLLDLGTDMRLWNDLTLDELDNRYRQDEQYRKDFNKPPLTQVYPVPGAYALRDIRETTDKHHVLVFRSRGKAADNRLALWVTPTGETGAKIMAELMTVNNPFQSIEAVPTDPTTRYPEKISNNGDPYEYALLFHDLRIIVDHETSHLESPNLGEWDTDIEAKKLAIAKHARFQAGNPGDYLRARVGRSIYYVHSQQQGNA